jgi:hypothetical protein
VLTTASGRAEACMLMPNSPSFTHSVARHELAEPGPQVALELEHLR